MKRETFRILFFLKKQDKKSNGKMPIVVRITINGTQTQFSIKADIDPKLWCSETGKARGRSQEAVIVNNRIEQISTKIRKHYDEIVNEGLIPTAELVVNAYKGLYKNSKTLLDVFAEVADHQKKLWYGEQIKEVSYKRYIRIIHIMENFMSKEYKLKDIPLANIDRQFIMKFEAWLFNNGFTTDARKPMQMFKKVIVHAYNERLIERNPFNGYTLPTDKVERECLTMKEIQAIMEHEFCSDRIVKVRDVFIFQCFTGLSFIDIFNLTEADLSTDNDGNNKWIVKRRQKTNTKSLIPLHEVPLGILAKYKGKQAKLLPIISNVKMNEYLKEIMNICGITTKITTHIARHTFAMTITLENGVPRETVQAMLGHKSIRTTEIYTKMTKRKIGKDMKELSGVLNEQYKNVYSQ